MKNKFLAHVRVCYEWRRFDHVNIDHDDIDHLDIDHVAIDHS